MDFWVAAGVIVTLLGVLAALIIAIWGQWLGSLFFKPALRVSIEMHAPDWIKIQARVNVPGVAPIQTTGYFCRLRVTNDGNRAAENVEVRLLKLRIVPNGGHGRLDEHFLPLSLVWADIERVTAPWIQPKLYPLPHAGDWER